MFPINNQTKRIMIVSEFLDSKRGDLVDVLLSAKEEAEQTDLFGREDDEETLNSILDELAYFTSSRKPLYVRWSREVDGKNRYFSVPQPPLARLIGGYLLPLVKSKAAHEKCHGGEKGWSPKSSLMTHLPCASVLSFDLKRAFESLPSEKVYKFFRDLFESSEYMEETCRFLTLITTVGYEHGRGLPIGSPLSMGLFNRSVRMLDERLNTSSLNKGFRYSRWVDDITISSPREREIESFLGALELTDQQYPISHDKIFFQNIQEGIYLLGHVLSPDGRIRKNTMEERIENKVLPLSYEILSKGTHEPW